jgi:alkanesulfonate monooxygenase SsuD/methylene tetrahydromethanopterin reductase-like flavin-dependent oxidoreductase (luciferase family)
MCRDTVCPWHFGPGPNREQEGIGASRRDTEGAPIVSVSLALFGHPAEQHPVLARAMEEAGFDGVWIGEHVVRPLSAGGEFTHVGGGPPIVSAHMDLYDVWAVCGAIVGATSTLRVSTGVCIAPLRNPLVLAQVAVTLSKLSSGRFRLGVGAGWLEEEFAALGCSFTDRFVHLERAVAAVQSAAAAQPVTAEVERRSVAVMVSEIPTSIPIIFGGTSAKALRRAATLGDGWYSGPIDIEDCIRVRDTIEQYRPAGRPEFQYHVRITGPVSAARLADYHDAGFSELVVPWESLWAADDRQNLPVTEKVTRVRAAASALGLPY